jgi:hypothetical protein
MNTDVFRRPPMVDIPDEQVTATWQRWTRHLAERQLWRGAKTFADLCELSAQFCEGKLSKTPDHGGSRCEETARIGGPLAHANRQGFLTTVSQPGEDVPLYHGGELHGTGQQRAAVEGWAHPDTADQLRRLFDGTRIQVKVSHRRKWRADYSQVVNVSRYVPRSGEVREETHFGFVPSECTNFIDLGRPDLTGDAVYVTAYDPLWGDHNLLWERLSAPDWDNPPPPNASLWNQWYERTPPTDEQVEHLSQAVEQAFAERDRLVDVWRKTGRDEDESAADAQDGAADGLLTQYNAACQAQYAESDRRRSENLARYAEMQVAREMERDGGGTFVDMPPPAEPYQPRVEVCGICDQPGSAHPKADHSPEGYDPEDGHHYCPKGRRCPTCQTRPEPPKSSTTRPPRHAAAATPSSSGATMTSADTYSGLRARIMGVASRAPERQGPLQQALQGVEEDIAELNSISENSSQAGIQEALGSLMRAKESIEEANWMVGAAQASTEGAAAGLQ